MVQQIMTERSVMSLASSPSVVSSLLQGFGNFTHEMCLFYGAEIVQSLEELHRNNVIHRDLKPDKMDKVSPPVWTTSTPSVLISTSPGYLIISSFS